MHRIAGHRTLAPLPSHHRPAAPGSRSASPTRQTGCPSRNHATALRHGSANVRAMSFSWRKPPRLRLLARYIVCAVPPRDVEEDLGLRRVLHPEDSEAAGRVHGVEVERMEAVEEERLVAGGGRVDQGLAEGDGIDSAEFKPEE